MSKADKDKGTNVKVANPGRYFGFIISGIGRGLGNAKAKVGAKIGRLHISLLVFNCFAPTAVRTWKERGLSFVFALRSLERNVSPNKWLFN